MRPDEQILLLEGRHIFSKQVRYYSDELFRPALQNVVTLRLSSPSPSAFSVLRQSWRVLPLKDDASSARTELYR